MKTDLSDLAIGLPFIKGQNLPVKYCWHFSTDGTVQDVLFRDEEDFVAAMNRIYLLAQKYDILILAFCLMDNHIHFILYGAFDEANRFMHEYVRQTSMSIARKYNLKKNLRNLEIHHQDITDDAYLKTAICYVIKNPPVAGLPWQAHDYPWSSGSLYFRSFQSWTAPGWHSRKGTLAGMSTMRKEQLFHTRESLPDSLEVIDGLILPTNYIPVDLVERIFRSHRSYMFFLGRTKEEDVESRGGAISRLSLPDNELRQHKREILKELFGRCSSRELSTTQRLRLGRELRRRYNCSVKQVARMVGLRAEELAGYL